MKKIIIVCSFLGASSFSLEAMNHKDGLRYRGGSRRLDEGIAGMQDHRDLLEHRQDQYGHPLPPEADCNCITQPAMIALAGLWGAGAWVKNSTTAVLEAAWHGTMATGSSWNRRYSAWSTRRR